MISSLLFCLFLTLLYVIPLYLIPTKIKRLSRDEPNHIKYRLIASTFSTLLMVIISYLLKSYDIIPWNFQSNISFLLLIGFKIDNIIESFIITIILFGFFYLGPIIVNVTYIIVICSYNITVSGKLIEKQTKTTIFHALSRITDMYLKRYSKIALFRNFIFATITEELVFRALMIPVLYKSLVLESNYLSFHIILICPIFFGIAHIHHCIEEIRNGSKISTAAIKTLIQITYTSIFGFIAALLFMRTGNFISPLIAHIICNFYGLPDLGFTMSSSDQLSFMYSYRHFLLFLHAFGLILFGSTVMILTEKLSKSSFYWNIS